MTPVTPEKQASSNVKDNQALLNRTNTRKRPHTLFNWWQEIISMLLAFAALLALFATLYIYVDKPSPDWPQWLSINTVVSIYVVLLKACVIFVIASGLGQLKWEWFAGRKARSLRDLVTYDSASRGPLGALALLWTVHFSHVLSSLGAIIIVLALATEPFAQQIIHYYECPVPKSDTQATVPRTNYYDEANGEHTGAGEESISPVVQNAFLGGVFNPIPVPSAHCGTGNCTFQREYSSVGWCSACTDVTDRLTFNNVSWTYREPGYNYTQHTWNLTTTLPSGLSVNTPFGGVDIDNDYRPEQFAAMGPNLFDSYIYGKGFDFILGKNPQSLRPWINPATYNKPWPGCDTASNNKTLWKCKGYGASSCSLYPCVKTYSGSIKTGAFKEATVAASSEWGIGLVDDDGVPPLTTLDTDCITYHERQSLERLGYKFQPEKRWLEYNLTFAPLTKWSLNDSFPDSMVKRNCVFAMDTTFALSLGVWASGLLNGTIDAQQSDEDGAILNYIGPQIVQSIYNFGDVDFERMEKIFDNISIALTNYIRQNGVSNFSASATGTTYEEKTCIAVHWLWLIYPSAFVVLSLVFLVLILIETRTRKARPEVWKTSPLALLYYGLFDEDGAVPVQPGGQVTGRKAMEKYADATTAKLTSAIGDTMRLEVQDKFVMRKRREL